MDALLVQHVVRAISQLKCSNTSCTNNLSEEEIKRYLLLGYDMYLEYKTHEKFKKFKFHCKLVHISDVILYLDNKPSAENYVKEFTDKLLEITGSNRDGCIMIMTVVEHFLTKPNTKDNGIRNVTLTHFLDEVNVVSRCCKK